MDKRTTGPAKCIAYVTVTNITGIRAHPFTAANLQLAEHSQCTDFREYEVRSVLEVVSVRNCTLRHGFVFGQRTQSTIFKRTSIELLDPRNRPG
jgi:hypothetical protein